jgi:amidase
VPYPDELPIPPRKLRIGWTTNASDPNVVTHTECVTAVKNAATLLESLGHDVVESRPSAWDDPEFNAQFSEHFVVAYGVWTAADIDRMTRWVGRPVTEDDVEPGTWAVASAGWSATGLQYLAAIEFLHSAARRLATWWADDGFDVLLTPTLTEPPPRLGEFPSTTDDPFTGLFHAAQLVPFCMPFNTTGQPAISVPLHWTADDLPVGVQLVGAFGEESLLLRLATQLEEAAPWAGRRPPTHA